MMSSPAAELQPPQLQQQQSTPPSPHNTPNTSQSSPSGQLGSSPKYGFDKSTQTLNRGAQPTSDPSVFCNALCTMLLDRIKDTLQEAMKSYSTDTDREHKMKSIVNEAITNAGNDIDKKLSIVSVQSLMQQSPTLTISAVGGNEQEAGHGSLPPSRPSLPPHHTTTPVHMLPPPPSSGPDLSTPLLMSSPVSSVVSDYINKLSFIYGPSRPSMFNPYVKPVQARNEPVLTTEEKENLPTLGADQHTSSESTDKSPVINMEVENTGEQDINIVDDVEEESGIPRSSASASLHRHNIEEATASSPITSRGSPVGVATTAGGGGPITPIPLTLSPGHLNLSPNTLSALSPSTLQEKFGASSLAANGFVDSSVQYELQKILLSAAMAHNSQGGTVPGFSPASILSTTASGKETEARQDHIPVMIPSLGRAGVASNGFFDKREYSCDHCEATFSYGSKLRAHMICVHSIKSYQCRQCRKSFLDKDEYIKHLDLHPQKKFQCDKCPSSFDKQHQLSLHYRSHTNEKPYRCQICQRQFAVNDALIRHMRIHTGERPYACQVCGKRFAQKSGLTYHSYLHTGNRPYKCTTCGQGFVHRQALKQHLMKNHLNEQVGRILNSASSAVPATFSPSNQVTTTSQGGLAWDKESIVTAEAMKRAFSWETKDQPAAFKLEGMAS